MAEYTTDELAEDSGEEKRLNKSVRAAKEKAVTFHTNWSTFELSRKLRAEGTHTGKNWEPMRHPYGTRVPTVVPDPTHNHTRGTAELGSPRSLWSQDQEK